MCRHFEPLNLVWIEEPLDAYDHEGHAALAAQFDTPIATGAMLTSAAKHADLVCHRAADLLMPDAPRVGGITPFLICAGRMQVPTRPGLGLSLSEQARAWTWASADAPGLRVRGREFKPGDKLPTEAAIVQA
jgi:L-alanine-DL-glutamate epimerase-like enolase superfamily enzyme